MEGNLIFVLIAYFLGNFSTSYFIGKLFGRIDIREHGSGNAGSTNVLRTLGVKAAALTFLGDSLKGVLAVYMGAKMGGENLAIMCGVAVVIGHNWPVFLGFKGGKGIATSIGVILMIKPSILLICAIIGIAVLLKFKYVSLASISALSFLPIVILLSGNEIKYFYFGIILAILGVYRHKENIKRLLAGNESKIGKKSIVK